MDPLSKPLPSPINPFDKLRVGLSVRPEAYNQRMGEGRGIWNISV
jgi:hypothetical protein